MDLALYKTRALLRLERTMNLFGGARGERGRGREGGRGGDTTLFK